MINACMAIVSDFFAIQTNQQKKNAKEWQKKMQTVQ